MKGNFSLDDIRNIYPSAFDEGEIDYKKLCIILADEVNDLQDQMSEKDYQILRITQRLESLEN
jgi:hypothetical protein